MSFFGRFKANANPTSPGSISPLAAKKDYLSPQQTPLEKLLVDSGPLRHDGSDKFFGFENFGSTCYANSIIQCLYYTTDFRDEVLKYPSRSPLDLSSGLGLTSRWKNIDNEKVDAVSVTAPRTSLPPPSNPASPRRAPPIPLTPGTPGYKPEDNKDSSEFKKKMALAAGPVLDMSYENSTSYGMTESLFTALKDIFEAIIAHRSRYGIVSPHKFLEILRKDNEMFRSIMHQDAHEFFNLLINTVVEGLAKHSKGEVTGEDTGSEASVDNARWVQDLFEGTLTSETRCLTCETTSHRDETFFDLSVDIERHASVTACLRKFSEEEMLCERNKFHCDNCGGLQEAEKRMKIKKSPRILALHLKRFKYTEDFQRLQKLFHRVVYPYHLRLFNTTDDAEDPDRMYELYAVVVHIGAGPYHGHYVSIIKTQDRGWLLFDDELVEPVNKDYVQNFFGDENKLACAYVLFYRETTLEAVQQELESETTMVAARAADAALSSVIAEEKTNGVSLNGWHTPYSPLSSPSDTDHFAKLDQAITIPAPQAPAMHSMFPGITDIRITSPQAPGRLALSTIMSTPALPVTDSLSKKERKLAEKEAAQRTKQEVKDREAKRREQYQKRAEAMKKQEDDIKAAIAASKLTKIEEDRKGPAPAPGQAVAVEPGGAEADAGAASGGLMIGGLSRFRQSSVSLRAKPRFWSPKDKDKVEVRDSTAATTTTTPAAADVFAPQRIDENAPPVAAAAAASPVKPERSKSNRFSFGRKMF